MTKKKKRILWMIGILGLVVCVVLLGSHLRANDVKIDLQTIEEDTTTLTCAVFDGEKVWEDSTVVIEDGMITEETILKEGEKEQKYFLMPGLLDGHAHLSTPYQMEQSVKNGVTTVCDVSASADLEESYQTLEVWSSRSSIWLDVEDPESFVADTIAQGGKYIKVVADVPQIMGGGMMERSVLEALVQSAHEKSLKVAVHAISIETVRMATEVGVDMLIHIPIGETFPKDLAETIAEKQIAVMPTLAMMQAFANSPFYGYDKEDYQDAKEGVALLHSLHVPILVATDASDSFFVPKLKHGAAVHDEMKLLVEAGLTPLEVLQSATKTTAEIFGIEGAGTIETGKTATMILVEGRPDQQITDSTKIIQIWIDGKPILEREVEMMKIQKGKVDRDKEELLFYPKHPSGLKTHKIETKAMPLLEQETPFEVRELCMELSEDLEKSLGKYQDKRFEVTGIVTKIGPDIHNKPSVELSDQVDGQCYALCIFPTDDFYQEVTVGDRVTIRANYLVMSNWYGVVMKYSELVRK